MPELKDRNAEIVPLPENNISLRTRDKKPLESIPMFFNFSGEKQALLDYFLSDKVFSFGYGSENHVRHSPRELIQIFERLKKGEISSIYLLEKRLQVDIVRFCCPELGDDQYFSSCMTRDELFQKLSNIPYMLGSKRTGDYQHVFITQQIIEDARMYFSARDKRLRKEECSDLGMLITSHLGLRATVVRLGTLDGKWKNYADRVLGIFN